MLVQPRERERLLTKGETQRSTNSSPIHVYRRRWWVLFLVSYVGTMQCLMWNTFGPISHSSRVVLGWTDDIIALITNFINVGYMVAVIPVSLLMDSKGLRMSMILSAGLLLLGTCLRCLPLESESFLAIVHFTAFLCGCAGVVPYGGPSKVAAVWFPPEQRTTAAALVSFSNYVGISLGLLISPLFVHDPIYGINVSDNASVPNAINGSCTPVSEYNGTAEIILVNFDQMRSGISYLLYFQTGLAALLMLLVLVYFPERPPKPPSNTASLQRMDFRKAFKAIARNKNLWTIMLAGSIPRGVIGSWIPIFDIVATKLGVTQVDAGQIGFLHIFIGCVASIFIARLSERLACRKKVIVLIMTILSVIFGAWTTFLCTRVIPFDLGSLYASHVMLGVLQNGAIPLYYELCAETAYPAGEGIVGGIYTFVLHVIAVVYLSVASVPNQDIDWLTWTVLASVALPLPLIFLYNEQSTRSDLDRSILISVS